MSVKPGGCAGAVRAEAEARASKGGDELRRSSAGVGPEVKAGCLLGKATQDSKGTSSRRRVAKVERVIARGSG
jgi:hypothetical protein